MGSTKHIYLDGYFITEALQKKGTYSKQLVSSAFRLYGGFMQLVELVAKQLNSVRSKEEFDKIFNYHYPTNPAAGKEILKRYGVDFHRFDPIEAQPMEVHSSKINVDVLTKMVIDKPIIIEDKNED